MMPLQLDALLQFLWDGTDETIIEDLIARDPVRSQRQFEAARAIVETISGPSGPGALVSNRLRTIERALALYDPGATRASRADQGPVRPYALARDIDVRRMAHRREFSAGIGRRGRSSAPRTVSASMDPYSIPPPPEPRTLMLGDPEPARLLIQGLAIVLQLLPTESGRERTLSLSLISSVTSIYADAQVLLWRDTTVVQSATVDEEGHAEFVWVDPGPYHLRIDIEHHVIVLELLRPDPGNSAKPT
jgi:hypothetical protein